MQVFFSVFAQVWHKIKIWLERPQIYQNITCFLNPKVSDKKFISPLSLQYHWVDLFRYKELTIHLQLLLSITANLSKSWTTNEDKMKDDPEPPVLPPAASSPLFKETLAKITPERARTPRGGWLLLRWSSKSASMGRVQGVGWVGDGYNDTRT